MTIQEKIEKFKQDFPHYKNRELAKKYRVSLPTVQRWARELGLKKKKAGRPRVIIKQ